MKGRNLVILLGNCGGPPDYHELEDGTPVAKFSLATTEHFKLKDGSVKTHTEWHSVVVWRWLAAFTRQYVRKGSLLFLQGRLKHRSYTDAMGETRYVCEVVANEIVLLDKKPAKAEHPEKKGFET